MTSLSQSATSLFGLDVLPDPLVTVTRRGAAPVLSTFSVYSARCLRLRPFFLGIRVKSSLKWLLQLIVAGAAIAVLVVLIRLSTGVSAEDHRLRLAALDDVGRADAELTRVVSIAYVRNDATAGASDVPAAIRRLRESVQALYEGNPPVAELDPLLTQRIAAMEGIVATKTKLAAAYVDQLQPLSARVIDSVDSTLKIVSNRPHAADAAIDAQIHAEADALVRQLISYGSTSSEDDRAGVQRRIEALTALTAPLEGELPAFGDDVAAATQTAVNNKQDQLSQLSAITGSPTTIALRSARQAYNDFNEARQREAALYRRALNGYTAFLLVLIAWFALRLGKSFRALDAARLQLTRANETLEEQVKVRTADLSRAYDNLRESQAQLIQSEKMATLGQMVAGVAHEINTPLGYVRSNTGILLTTLDDLHDTYTVQHRAISLLANPGASEEEVAAAVGEAVSRNTTDQDALFGDLRELLKDADYGLGQISDLVLTLKDFSRVDRALTDQIDMNAGLDSTLKICHNMLKGRIEVVRHYGELPYIECAPSQINQVFLNLITNAAQAIKGEGLITLSTAAEKDGIVVRVRDNGAGMPESVRARIFEPFYTTKDVGQGTGLGLSIVYRIIEEHGGSIDVSSEVGVGTEFVVRLPLHQQHRNLEKAAA